MYILAFLMLALNLTYSHNSSADELSDFLLQNKKVGQKYTALSKSLELDQLILSGKKSVANYRLKNLVQDADKTASDYFIVSNMLFKSDPETSHSFMKTANLMMPNNPYITFELAIHEHRNSNCKAALPLYQKADTLLKNHKNNNLWAYLTHCHLVLGNYKEAIKSWEKVDFGKHHISVEKSMYEIFSNRDLELEREKLLNSILSGSAQHVCDLIELDKNWEIDWWNIKVNNEFLKYDIELLKKLSQHNKKIESAVKLCSHGTTLSDKEFIELATKLGHWGGDYILAEEPASSYVLIRELSKRKIANPEEILMRYENQLVSRHSTDPSNRKTLDLLAYLYESTGNHQKLKEIDLHGWKNLKIQKYAESYISRIPTNTPEYPSDLESAANDFPNSVKIQRENLSLNYNSDKRLDYLAKFVAAQFANVNNHLRGPDRLNNFMTSLESEINSLMNNNNRTTSRP